MLRRSPTRIRQNLIAASARGRRPHAYTSIPSRKHVSPKAKSLLTSLLPLVAGFITGLAASMAAAASESASSSASVPVVIEPRWRHLRQLEPQEWASFPLQPDGKSLEATFAARQNDGEWTLRLRQADVKQVWRVLLNEKPLGELVRDEQEMVIYLPIGRHLLRDGENKLQILSTAQAKDSADDIRVGEIYLEDRPVREWLSQATLEITVLDQQTRSPLPARITLVDERGGLQTTAADSNDRLAVRPGVIYTSDGVARCGIPPGKYTVYAGRGFEYSLAHESFEIKAGDALRRTLSIRREVPTAGYVACDTHLHTRTHSGHGDSTVVERVITLAGEGIELPIATDHNVHIDYELTARQANVRQFFTPVAGNEVTTPAGHFNVFPVAAGARIPGFRSAQWSDTFRDIFATPGVRVAILNHARDIHAGVRPFGEERFQSVVGEQLDGWPYRFNAMEVINSGATQTDPLQLPRDWMTLLNRGQPITPVGSSDSHDVSRYIPGQGRTYIRCDDRDVGQLDVGLAVDSFVAGRVMVSYGLIAELSVEGKYGPGDLAAVDPPAMGVQVRVLGPSWVSVSRVLLYLNGQLIREEPLARASSGVQESGVLGQATWQLPVPRHDFHLVAIALGPGVSGAYWPTAKPYQPRSPAWNSYVMGVSGAVWIDGDRDGRRTAAREYAERLWHGSKGNLTTYLADLAEFDVATAAHAAHVARTAGIELDGETWLSHERKAAARLREGFRIYRETWRENERARAIVDTKP